ncbi:MAG: tRNA epoxyqueuosine(34) reductase QueG [Armatimonadota bacterium]
MNDNLTAQLKKRAFELGLSAVGIAPAAALDFAEEALKERVESGRLKDYGFSRKPAERFTHPESLVPEAKSMIVVAWPYLATEKVDEGRGPKGLVARFATGQDYHVVVTERLQELGEWLVEQIPSAKCKICVDTGSMIDRAAARAAGIGSYGKNASIITEKSGSWVVLGEMVTDVELEYDDPAPMEECGDCDICVRNCPSGAIACPFVIDQTRCISHLTQMKGIIPRELRPIIGDSIYGCDICQESCPKNVGISSKQGEETLILHHPALIPLLNISQEEFDRIIGPTAIAWIGRTRFRRNVAVALGNIGDPSAVTVLIEALNDPEPVIRVHAAWALGQIGGNDACEALRQALKSETDERVIGETESALGSQQICKSSELMSIISC